MHNETVDRNFRLFVERGIPRFDQGGSEKFEEPLTKFKPSLIVIDTLANFKLPGESKGYEGKTKAMSEIRLMTNRYNADLIYIHHTQKANSE